MNTRILRPLGFFLFASLFVAGSTSADEASSADETSSGGEDSPEEAGARICGAFDTVRNAVSLQTNADLGADPVAVQAVAANSGSGV